MISNPDAANAAYVFSCATTPQCTVYHEAFKPSKPPTEQFHQEFKRGL